jgi:alkylation response protein AidB-like acyl-CoA dehydrogenase
MNFETNEDQDMVRETVSRYAADSLAPNAEAWDEARQLPGAVFDELRDLGLLGLTLPAEHGGSELDDFAALLCVEELARCDASTALSLVAHGVLAGELAAGVDAVDLVEDIAAGRSVASWAMTDADGLVVGDARINGRASGLVQCRRADLAVVFGHDARGEERVALVDVRDADVERLPADDALGCRAADLGAWSFDDAECVAVASPTSAPAVARTLERAQTFIGAVAVGIARGALEEGLAYANDREQFGRPISRFQVTQFKLADMSTRVDAARLSVLRSASKDAPAGRRARANALACDVAIDAADEAVQLHGGYGYTSEYPVERYLRDARTVASVLDGHRRRMRVSPANLADDSPLFA